MTEDAKGTPLGTPLGTRPGKPLRVLLVEDSENDAMLLLREIRRGGYEPAHERVYTPEAMERALRGADARGEPFEVVVSDYYMPRFRAPEALELFKGLGYDAPFIVVSGKIGEDAAVGIMKAGANDYLTKENMARLCPAIERELKETEDRLERARAEEALARSEERYRTFVAQSTEGIWRFELGEPLPVDLPQEEKLDHFYRHAYLAECNDAMARMYGYESAFELVGARMGDLMPRSEPGNLRLLAEVTRGGYRLTDGESREVDRNGDERVFVNNLTGVVEGGLLVRVWGTRRDVTEQRESEDLLARLASFPELSPSPIIETSVAGEPTYLNPAAQARFPDLRALGGRHPALSDLEGVNRKIWAAGGRPFVREVRVGGQVYQQTVSRTPESGLLRIYGNEVTERRRAEDALRTSEERFRSLVQNASDIIVVLDAEGTITYESPAVERVLGFTPEERLGMNAFDLIHPDDRGPVARAFAEYLDKPGPFPPLEYRVKEKDGAWRRLEAVGENLLHDPVIGGIVVNSRDVTERAEAEEALRESRERLQAILDNTTAVIYVKDAGGRYELVNRRFEELFHVAKEEVVGRTDRDFFTEEAAAAYRENDREVLRSEAPLEVEETVAQDDGTHTYVSVKFPLMGPHGAPYATCGISTDITARKRAERELGESEQLYRSVVEQAAENIFLVDVASKRILEANAALGDSLGYAPEELREMTLYDVVAHDPESIDANTEEILREGRRSLGTRRYRRRDGTHAIVEVNVSAIPYGGRRAMCIVAHDVTERKRAEQALEEIREAERGRMARELHDSILQDIVYALQEMQVLQVTSHDGGEPALQNAADALRRSVEGLRGAIFDLRLEETLDRSFVSSLESLMDLNRRMARGRYELELAVENVPERLPGGLGQEVVRVVQEALTNVRRHAGATRARVEVGLEGGVLRARISDDGRGFDAGSVRDGMGRYSMRQRALDLGGAVEVQSEPGGGTRVCLEVPLPAGG